MTAIRAAFDRATLAFLFVLIAITAARIVALFYIPLGLYFDEAQYWMWSRTFDWGYFTKPPLIAWVIGTTTFLAGERGRNGGLLNGGGDGVAGICNGFDDVLGQAEAGEIHVRFLILYCGCGAREEKTATRRCAKMRAAVRLPELAYRH